jgi:hypothetical protein
MMTENNKYGPGCYGDGSFGSDHTMTKVFEIATIEGWRPDIGLDDIIMLAEDSDNTFEYIQCLEDEAIDYLNEHCSDDTHYWGYENGDFGYWEIDEE